MDSQLRPRSFPQHRPAPSACFAVLDAEAASAGPDWLDDGVAKSSLFTSSLDALSLVQHLDMPGHVGTRNSETVGNGSYPARHLQTSMLEHSNVETTYHRNPAGSNGTSAHAQTKVTGYVTPHSAPKVKSSQFQSLWDMTRLPERQPDETADSEYGAGDRKSEAGSDIFKAVTSVKNKPTVGRPSQPMVRRFAATSVVSLSVSLEWALLHCNMPQIRGTCCSWHAAVTAAMRELEHHPFTNCDPKWIPLSEWQCSVCLALNLSDNPVCDMCCQGKPTKSAAKGSTGSLRARRRLLAQQEQVVVAQGQQVAGQASNSHAKGTPLAESLATASNVSLGLCLQWVLKHWNLPLIPGACCPFHSMVRVAQSALISMAKSECDPSWSAFHGWQCPTCLCVNHGSVQWCDLCWQSNEGFVEAVWLEL